MPLRWALSPVILLYAEITVSTPVTNFPLNSQLPPVARISEPFSFDFSPQTFSSPYTISYSLISPPEWLSIDSSSRRLFGTPTDQEVAPGEVVEIPISINAEDEEGAITANSTLVVSRNPAPVVNIPLSDQISGFGSYSAPSSIVISPSTEFSFSFNSNTFSPSGLSYYAVLLDNTPLPSWINFNPGSISFSGRTPPHEILPPLPQDFDIKLVASDVAGFSSVSVPFTIRIASHELTTSTSLVTLSATSGTAFEYTDLPNLLRLDNEPLDRANVSSITTDGLPDWLQFDTETWNLSGTPGPTAESANVTVSITDVYSDNLSITLAIQIDTDIFLSDLPGLNVSSGTDFTFNLEPYLRNSSDVEVELQNQSQASWIHLDASNLELSGTVPESSTAVDVEIVLEARSKSTQKSESRSLSIRIAAAITTSPSSSGSATSQTPISTSIPPETSSTTEGESTPYTPTRILLGVLVPLILICIIALIVLLCCWRKRRRQHCEEKDKPEVSAPIPGSFVKHDAGSHEGGALYDGFDIGPTSVTGRSLSGSFAPDVDTSLKTSISNQSIRSSNVPNAILTHGFDFGRPLSDSAVRETRESWLGGQAISQDRTSPKSDNTVDALSDESNGTGHHDIQGATQALVISSVRPQSYRRSLVTSPVPGLSVPVVHVPHKVQPPPETGFITGSNDLEEEARPRPQSSPEPPYTHMSGLGIQRSDTSSSQRNSTRLSGTWLQPGTATRPVEDSNKRKSTPSTSTAQTTRTSILTSTANEEPTTPTTPRATVVHLPGRLGVVRKISRGSRSFFGGGSSKSPKKSTTPTEPSPNPSSAASDEPARRTPPSIPYDKTVASEGDSKGERSKRDSLDTAYRDLIKSSRESVKARIAARLPSQTSNFSIPHKKKSIDDKDESSLWNTWESKDMISPEHWPIPAKTPATPDLGSMFKAPPQLPAIATGMTPMIPSKDDGRGKTVTQGPEDTDTSPTKSATAQRIMERQQLAEQNARIRISRLREQQALEQFRTMMSKSDPTWPHAAPRPLPEPPSRPPRGPAVFLPQEAPGRSRIRSNVSRRSTRSAKTTMSEHAETDDGWEDLRPESTAVGEQAGTSSRDFAAFI